MRNFYAIYWRHPGLVDEDGLPDGPLYVFSSIKDRDNWIDDGQNDHLNRQAVDSGTAARLMRRYISDSYVDMHDVVGMAELVASYLGIASQDLSSVDRRRL